MDRQTGAWFQYLEEWLVYLDQQVADVRANLGNPVDQAKVTQLKKAVDAKKAELKAAIDAND